MKVVAIIPARGGSQRIPDKNIRLFSGKPIIAYSIETALKSGLFQRVIVSTDSGRIADIARHWGAEVPFRRPENLADSFTPLTDVLVHAVEWLKENGGCDYFCSIHAAAPFLDATYLRQGFDLVKGQESPAAMSVVRFGYPIYRALKKDENGRLEMVWPEYRTARSQDLPEMYHDAAQFYWVGADYFLQVRKLMMTRPIAVFIPEKFVHDIDTDDDWEIAERKYQALKSSSGALRSSFADLPIGSSNVVLGTAQLGFSYGVANRIGRPDAHTANSMLCAAWSGGIRLFDTAQAYGDSEHVLGDFFAGSYGFSDARFISKLHPGVLVNDRRDIRRYIEESLRRLRTSYLWALLLHREAHYDDLPGNLGETLRQLRLEGLFKHLGISVYSPKYAQRAVADSEIAIIEIPLNVFDRRMVREGIVDLARVANKLVVLRSIFLQGLALMDLAEVPASIPRGQEAVSAYWSFCREHGLSPREFAYDYARALCPNALIVIGAETTQQVTQNCELQNRPAVSMDLVKAWEKVWPEDAEGLCDPSKWETS